MNSAAAHASKIGVLLVEDQTAIRQMMATFVAATPGLVVAGEASTAREAITLCIERQPAVVVLDWMLPDGTGQQVLAAIRQLSPAPKVLVFSANNTELAVRGAFQGGARGYIEKTSTFEEFAAAVKKVAAGDIVLGSTIANLMHRLILSPAAVGQDSELSPRENDVLRLVAEGLSSKEIAARLGLSVRTAENHRAAICRKTGFHSVAQLALHAYELGLVSLPGAANGVPAA